MKRGGDDMKHTVTVRVETRKHFLGIPYMATEKKKLVVDGKTYLKMKREEQDRHRADSESAACAAMELEEEMADLFGE